MKVMEVLRGNTGRMLLSTVSGVSSTKAGLIEYFDQEVPAIDMITTKSFQVVPTAGNPEPIICEPETGSFGNSVGLRNIGANAAFAELEKLRRKGLRCLLDVSLAAKSPEDFISLVKTFRPVADLLELNFSCPHAAAGFGASIGTSAEVASAYVRSIRQAIPDLEIPLFVKLTPNVEDIGSIARAVVQAGADGITAINTVGPDLYIEPHAHEPILQNQLGGKGGKSGRWVFDEAVGKIAEIRKAVGPDVPIIGMGGVDDGQKAARMMQAGANIVGLGSALAMVNQRQWPEYLSLVKREAQEILDGNLPERSARSFLRREDRMAYKPYRVVKREQYGEDIVVLTCDHKLDSQAGEFVFLWLPGVGEKPFSVAGTDPLSFIIKKRGKVTKEIFNLQEGDEVMVRGLYGAPVAVKRAKRALVIAGGTGVAVLPMLVRRLKDEGTEVTMLVGTSVSVEGPALLEKELSPYGPFTCVADDGKPGRVLDLLDSMTIDGKTAVYLIGPEVFMSIACKLLLRKGASEEMISLSMERMTRCGVGLCGECVCGHRLACQWGTFMDYSYLKANAPSLLRL